MIIIAASKTLSDKYDDKLDLNINDKHREILESIQKYNKTELGNHLKIQNDTLDNTYEMFINFGEKKYKSIDMYNGIVFREVKNKKKKYLKTNVYIISAFYGILNAHDTVSSYRMDFTNSKMVNKNLYKYWQDDVMEYINNIKSKQLLNLCSNEYFKIIEKDKVNKKIYYIKCKEKVPSAIMKRIRGEILNYCIQNNLKNYRRLVGIETNTIKIVSLEKTTLMFELK